MLSFLEALRSLGLHFKGQSVCVRVCVQNSAITKSQKTNKQTKSRKLSKRLSLNFLNCTLASPLPPSADQLCVPGVVVQVPVLPLTVL